MNDLTAVATPLADQPLVLGIMLLISLYGFWYTVLTRLKRSYGLGTALGQSLAILVSWVPVAIFAVTSAWSLIRLAHIYFG